MSSTQKPDPAVVVAVDGSGRGTGALRFAIDEARARGIGVRMAHVLDDHGTAGCEIMDSDMTQACAAASDVDFDWLFGRGRRADELVAAAGPGDLLVLGRAAPRDAGRPAVGTVTMEVAARTTAAMVVVPADWRSRDHHRLVVGVKSCANAGELLARAFAAASARHAALRIVHVCEAAEPAVETAAEAAGPVEGGSHPGDRRSPEGQILLGLVHDWSDVFPDVEVETAFAHGRPERVLVGAAADADILITARHHRDLRHPVRLGPTPRALLGTSDTPVEVVPLTGAPATAPLVLERSGTFLKS
ncbi:universal stress protein [Promicromonospora soli]